MAGTCVFDVEAGLGSAGLTLESERSKHSQPKIETSTHGEGYREGTGIGAGVLASEHAGLWSTRDGRFLLQWGQEGDLVRLSRMQHPRTVPSCLPAWPLAVIFLYISGRGEAMYVASG